MGFFCLDRRNPVRKNPEQTAITTFAFNTVPSDTQEAKDAYERYCELLGTDVERGPTSFGERVRRDYRWHTVQYWFVATLANGLLWLQIVIGAALTALGASDRPGTKTAVIYLGAASTVIAGFLTYFKSRNQPSRSRRLRQGLRNVRNKMDEAANTLANQSNPADPLQEAFKIIKMYDDVLAEAEANYPDLWVTVGELKKHLPRNLFGNSDADEGASRKSNVDQHIASSSVQAEQGDKDTNGRQENRNRKPSISSTQVHDAKIPVLISEPRQENHRFDHETASIHPVENVTQPSRQSSEDEIRPISSKPMHHQQLPIIPVPPSLLHSNSSVLSDDAKFTEIDSIAEKGSDGGDVPPANLMDTGRIDATPSHTEASNPVDAGPADKPAMPPISANVLPRTKQSFGTFNLT